MEVERYESASSCVEVARRPAAGALSPYLLTALEGWEQKRGRMAELREVPFPGVPLILDLGPGWEIESPAEAGFRRLESFVAGLHAAPSIVRAAAPAWGCIELRLTPLGARRVFGLPMHELANRVVELEDLLPGAGELTSRLRDAHDWETRFDLLEAFLVRRLADSAPPAPAIEWSWHRLRRTGGRVPIAELASELGWSHRRLISRFREQIGLAPKTVARVFRFDRAVGALRSPSPRRLADIAFACGYFDQAHLNRDFRELAGITPTEFAEATLGTGGTAA
jgi:AraC-like DNA-binding protein